ncbi:hypothetical protein ABT115_29065 [Streptomyces sp. NPDC001832]|uniref:LmrA/YxaF family transcription factor n=1 Tax=Streptomyces sp. NPDC001832 TaxID=3154527 RepID=UPI0033252FD1
MREGLTYYGVTSAREADGLAMLLLSALEGAMVLSRADQSLTPCRLVLAQILPLFPDRIQP